MKIKLIAEGSSKWERFIRRWGISLLIDDDILFDTFGDPYVFLENACRVNTDFFKIRHIVISHDDWDHISGLWYIINTLKNVNVYICPGFREEIKERIKSFGVNIIEAGSLLQIRDGIYTTGQIYAESEGTIIYEQSLVAKIANGLVIITGCAHPGIINIVDSVKKRFDENIYLVFGGLHLKDETIGQIQEVISKLKSYGVEKIAPLHCTGKIAKKLFKDVYKDKCLLLKRGEVLEI